MLHDPLPDPIHEAGADGLCRECGEPFPCPAGLAYMVSNVVPDEVHLVVTRDELATIVATLRDRGLHGLADRLDAGSRPTRTT